jgi:DNA-binding NtrC family response regulator
LTRLDSKGDILIKEVKVIEFLQQVSRCILFIDDDYVNFLYFNELLKDTRFHFIRAISLLQALHILTVNNNICIIFLSNSISENQDNFIHKQIKSRYPEIEIITIIDNNNLKSEIEILKMQGDLYINMQIDQDQIMALISELTEEIEYSNEFQISN